MISFFGLQDAVNALGGISMDFPYPVRDQRLLDRRLLQQLRASTSRRPAARCSTASEALALSRSRYFQYYADGEWHSDPTSDIGRIERQNLIISAALNKAKSTYNPLRLNSLLTSVVHDFSKDNGLSARRPVLPGRALPRLLRVPAADLHPAHGTGRDLSGGSDVEVVQPDETVPDDHPIPRGHRSGRSSPRPSTPTATRSTLPVPTTPTRPTALRHDGPDGVRAPRRRPPPPSTIPSYDPRPC